MLRTLRSAPKTARSAAPGRRLDELANWLEEKERDATFGFETVEHGERRRADPVLGIPTRAVVFMRRLARHSDARIEAGLSAPVVGRLRKETASPRERDYSEKLIALGGWLRANGFAQDVWGDSVPTPALIVSVACAHTTCTCFVCDEGSQLDKTCQFVSVCRAAVELDELIRGGPGSPICDLVRVSFEAMNALWEAAYQILEADPKIEERLEQLRQNPGEVARILGEPEFPTSCGLEFSVHMLRAIALALRTFGLDRCKFNYLSLGDAGVTGPGAPERRRAPEQHLASAGLGFVRGGQAVEVEALAMQRRKRSEVVDQRTRFIRAKSAS